MFLVLKQLIVAVFVVVVGSLLWHNYNAPLYHLQSLNR